MNDRRKLVVVAAVRVLVVVVVQLRTEGDHAGRLKKMND